MQDAEGKIVFEEDAEPLVSPGSGGGAGKKGAAGKDAKKDAKKISKQTSTLKSSQPAASGRTDKTDEEEPLKEVFIPRPLLHQDCYIYYGVPVVRFGTG